MSKLRKIIQIMFLLLIITMLFYTVQAASTSLTASSNNVTTGTSVTVTASVTAGAWNLNLSGNGQNKGLVGQTSITDNQSASTSISFTPTSAGNYTFTLSGDITEYTTDVTENVNKSITITVREPVSEPTTPATPTSPTAPTTPTQQTKSSNAKLANLGIRPNDFSGFKANTKRYEVTVPNDVSQVEVYATAQDAKATISGIGNKKLSEGSNNLSVIVTSEDGTKETYTIIVTRQVAEGEDITPNTNETNVADSTGEEIKSGLSKLEITGGSLSTEFTTNEYKYTVKLENNNIKTLSEFKKLITAEANFEGASIEVTADDEEFKIGRNKIYITVKDSDGREIAIYTLILKIEDETAVSGTTIEKDNDKVSKIDINKVIIISSIAIMSIFTVIVSIIAYKQRKVLEENGLVKTKEDEEDFDFFAQLNEEKIEEDSMENRRKKMDEFFNRKSIEFESDKDDSKTKKEKSGKRFQ